MPHSVAITTAQNVSLDYNVANLGDRIVAFIIDTLIKAAYAILCFFLLVPQFSNDNPGLITGIGIVLALPFIFYSLIFELFNNGQSPGKKAMQLKVANIDGSEVTFGSYFLRWIFRIIDINLMSGIVAVLTIAMSEKGQRLGDIVASTTVITLKQKASVARSSFEKISADYEPEYPSVTLLKSSDIETIKDVLRNRSDNAFDLKTRLSEKLEGVLGVKKNGSSTTFLQQIIKDFNFYDQSE